MPPFVGVLAQYSDRRWASLKKAAGSSGFCVIVPPLLATVTFPAERAAVRHAAARRVDVGRHQVPADAEVDPGRLFRPAGGDPVILQRRVATDGDAALAVDAASLALGEIAVDDQRELVRGAKGTLDAVHVVLRDAALRVGGGRDGRDDEDGDQRGKDQREANGHRLKYAGRGASRHREDATGQPTRAAGHCVLLGVHSGCHGLW